MIDFFECICISFRIWRFWVSTSVFGVLHLHHGNTSEKLSVSYVWNPFPNKKGLGLPRVSGIYTLQWTKSTSSLIHRSIGIYRSFLPGVFDPFWDIFQGDPGAQVRTKTLGPPTWRKIRRSCDRCSGTTFAWLSQTSWRQRQKEVTWILCFMKKRLTMHVLYKTSFNRLNHVWYRYDCYQQETAVDCSYATLLTCSMSLKYLWMTFCKPFLSAALLTFLWSDFLS